MGEDRTYADWFRAEIESFCRLWREERKYAVLLLCLLVPFGVYQVYKWHKDGTDIQALTTENQNLKRDLKQSEAEKTSLQGIVAPLMAQAAKEFPGEEIDKSLKKIIEKLEKDNPLQKPIATVMVTVIVRAAASGEEGANFMDTGGYAFFLVNDKPYSPVSGREVSRIPDGKGQDVWRGVFNLPSDDSSIGKPVQSLRDAEYIQVEFIPMKDNINIFGGSIIFVINGSLQLKFDIPTQVANGKKLYVRDLSHGMSALRD